MDKKLLAFGLGYIVLALFYYWPGAMVFSHKTFFLGPFPFYVFYSAILLPWIAVFWLFAAARYRERKEERKMEEWEE